MSCSWTFLKLPQLRVFTKYTFFPACLLALSILAEDDPDTTGTRWNSDPTALAFCRHAPLPVLPMWPASKGSLTARKAQPSAQMPKRKWAFLFLALTAHTRQILLITKSLQLYITNSSWTHPRLLSLLLHPPHWSPWLQPPHLSKYANKITVLLRLLLLTSR